MTAIAGRYQPLEAVRPGAPRRARDLQTAQTVLLREVVVQPERRAASLDRAHAAKGIFHPSLVTLFDVVELDGDRVLMAYEFVPAQPIAQVSGGQAFNLRRAAEIVAEIADATAALHAHDVAHGGIGQPSILITMKGKAKLDRIADPSLPGSSHPEAARDVAALGDLLAELIGRPRSRGVVGAQAAEALIERARQGKFESAATFAAMLRRIGP